MISIHITCCVHAMGFKLTVKTSHHLTYLQQANWSRYKQLIFTTVL